MPATTCTSSVTISDGALSSTANITLTPNISLAINNDGMIDNQCNYTLPGTTTYTAGASYASASGSISNGTVTSVDGNGISGVITNPLLGNFAVGWTVNSSGVVSSTTLNKTLSLVGTPITDTTLKSMLGANTAATSTISGFEAARQGCRTYCDGTRGLVVGDARKLCALTTGGGVACWGENSYQSTGAPINRNTPQLIPDISTAIKVAVGSDTFACALLANQTVKCWGNNSWGYLGNGTNTASITPVTVTGVSAATEIVAGASFACALDAGTPKCWGYNSSGLGQASGTNFNTPKAVTKTDGTTLTDMTKLSAGAYHVCAANTTEVWCWGNNTRGKLGDGTTTNRNQAVRVLDTNDNPFSPATDISSIVTADPVSCASSVDGLAWCWGGNYIGDGTSTPSYKAKQVLASEGVPLTGVNRLLSSNSVTIFAQMSDHSVKAWGEGLKGWKADGTSDSGTVFYPTTISGFAGGNTIAELSSSYSSSNYLLCTVQNDQTLQCWGSNTYGQLGTGETATSNYVPTTVSGLTGVTKISVSATNVCAVTITGSVYCWGSGRNNSLGIATNYVSTPYTIPGVSGITHLAPGGAYTTYALKSDGTVISWGSIGFYLNENNPVAVAGISNATSLVTNTATLCYTDTTVGNNVRCKGDNAYGQLGNGNTTTSSSPVLTSLGLTTNEKAIGLAASELTVCALISPSNTVKCWGKNDYGQVGLTAGSPASQTTPVQISGLTNVVALTAGVQHFCALLANGSVQCWGRNNNKQLGDGSAVVNSPVPVTVVGISNAVAINAGGNSSGSWTCAVIADRSLKCWGYNDTYGLGDGTAQNGQLATVLNLADGVLAVGGATNTICALTALGEVRCWGKSANGLLGNGENFDRKIPFSSVTGSFATWSNCKKLTFGP